LGTIGKLSHALCILLGVISMFTLIYDIVSKNHFFIRSLLSGVPVALAEEFSSSLPAIPRERTSPADCVDHRRSPDNLVCRPDWRIDLKLKQRYTHRHPWLTLAIIILFFREVGNYRFEIKSNTWTRQLFIISFLAIILIGTGLLLLHGRPTRYQLY